MIHQWAEKSRYNTLRHYHVSSDETTLTVTCHDVYYYSMSTIHKNELHSIDPDGGPYLCVGRTIEHEHQKWIIQRIQSHKKIKSTAVFVFDIQKVDSV
jgi:hypothetical protein